MKLTDGLLACGLAFPAVYFANLFGVPLLDPAFDHARQAPSDLGAQGAPYAALFNAGLGLSAFMAFLGAIGLVLGLRRLGAGLYVSVMTGLSLALLAFALAMSAAFPLPDPLHYGFNLYFAGLLTPLFGAIALGPVRGAAGARLIALLGMMASFALIVMTIGPFGLADASNQGLWIRALAFVSFFTIGYLCFAVLRGFDKGRETG